MHLPEARGNRIFALPWSECLCLPQNLYVEVPMLDVILGGRGLWEVLGNEGGAVVNDIWALIKETPQSFFASSVK